MEAVILAGGFGTRMRPLTYTRPKPLLPLLNRPLLAHIIDRMPAYVTKIILPVNYLKEHLEAYFEDHPDPRMELVEESKPLGTGGAIKNCADHLTGPFFVYNGDVISDLDLDALKRHHAARRAEATISLYPVDEPWHFGVVELAPDQRITNFVEKPAPGSEPSDLINAGHYVLEDRLLDEIEGGRLYSLERELYAPMAEAGRRLYGFPFQGHWIDCGRPVNLLEAHATLLRSLGKARVLDRGVRFEPTAHVEGYSVARGGRVAAGARIERSVLLADVHVGRDSVVRDSILGEGVEVEAGAVLERTVVGDFGVIEAGACIRDQRVGLRPADVEA